MAKLALLYLLLHLQKEEVKQAVREMRKSA